MSSPLSSFYPANLCKDLISKSHSEIQEVRTSAREFRGEGGTGQLTVGVEAEETLKKGHEAGRLPADGL